MINNGKIVAVTFPAGGGGKFIQNCLALSKYCVLKEPAWTGWQLYHPKFKSADFYQQKLDWVLRTIPPQNQMHNWLRYELKDRDYYGNILLAENIDSITDADFPNHVHETARQGLWTTYSSHTWPSAQYTKRFWPEVKFVNLYPCVKFARSWLHIKNAVLASDAVVDDNYLLPEAHKLGFDIDIDDIIYDYNKFYDQMQALYKWLDWDDFYTVSIVLKPYYDAYMSLHQLD